MYEGIYDQFITKFIGALETWKVGDPLDPATNMGALVSAQHKDKVMGYINAAKEAGGTIG